MQQAFAERVLKWFDEHGRKAMPWQQDITPYRVWISEVMLQQTQVVTVIPYFQRFMHVFPTVSALAEAPLDRILHLWTGLGYYSRARNVHAAAQSIMLKYNGVFPSSLPELLSLPGIGRSTAGAILSIAYRQPVSILDANVKRVLARYHAIQTPLNQKSTEQQLWEWADRYMDVTRPHHYTQAIMDLGALICTSKRPHCVLCPLQDDCLALALEQTHVLPIKKPLAEKPERAVLFWIIRCKNTVLLTQRTQPGVWQGLFSFPESAAPLTTQQRRFLKQTVLAVKKLPAFRHTFSHYHLRVTPIYITLAQRKERPAFLELENCIWYNLKNKQAVGLPKPVVELLDKLQKFPG